MAGDPVRQRIRGPRLAARVRRHGAVLRAPGDLPRRSRPRTGAGTARHRSQHRRAHHHQVRHPGAEAAVARPDAARRHGMGAGLLGTGGRLGPAEPAHHRPPRRRRVRRQRAEGMDVARGRRRHLLRPGPHRHQREQAEGHHLPRRRRPRARGAGAAAAGPDRRAPVRRGVLRRRAGAGREPDRGGERRLAAGPHQPRARAGGGRAKPGGDVPPGADRTGRTRPRTRPAGRSAGARPVRRPGNPGPDHPLQRRADHRRHPRPGRRRRRLLDLTAADHRVRTRDPRVRGRPARRPACSASPRRRRCSGPAGWSASCAPGLPPSAPGPGKSS